MPSESRKRDRHERDNRDRKSSKRDRHEKDRECERDRDKKGTDRNRDRDEDHDERRKHRKRKDPNSEEEDRRRNRKDHSRRSKKKDRDREDDSSSVDSRSRRKKHSHKSSKRSSRRDKEVDHDGDGKKESSRSSHQSSRRKDRDSEKREKRQPHESKKSKEPAKLVSIGPRIQSLPSTCTPLDSAKDYFAFHDHLRLYLYRSEGIYFEDLSSEETHAAFEQFCIKYNKGSLEEGFYAKELPEEAMDQCKRTKHTWNFKTSVAETKSLDLIKSGVKKQTRYAKVGEPKVKGPIRGPMPMVCTPVPESNVNGNRNATSGGYYGPQSTNTSTRTAQPHASASTNSNAGYYGPQSGSTSSSAPKRAMIAPRDDAQETQRFQSKLAASNRNGKQQDKEAILKSLGLGGLKPGEKITIAKRK